MIRILLVALFIPAILLSSCADIASSPGERALNEARRLERAFDLHKSSDKYVEAGKLLIGENKAPQADESRLGKQRIDRILMDYPLTREAAIKEIRETFPKITDKGIEKHLKRVDSIVIGGERHYFSGLVNTIIGLEPGLIMSSKKLKEQYKSAAPLLMALVADTGHKHWQPFNRPKSYIAYGSLRIPRKELPRTGLFKLWIPLPVSTSSQTDNRVLAISPKQNVKYPIVLDGDIGCVYMEFPLDDLKKDLKADIKFQFKSYARNHLPIDPNTVGSYDKESPLYKKYTTPGPNIAVTGSIKRTAERIRGKETNPLLIAKKLYKYVVEETTYSYMPHVALTVLDIPESVYVHEKRFGDCGAQSAYFSALCRSIGIPARACGGFQMMNMKKGVPGHHFWAEFYLPDHGWIPVDTSVAQMYINCRPWLTKAEQEKFKWFFFGSLDATRYVIQTDVDVPLTPRPSEKVMLPMAVQDPAALCSTMDELPAMLIAKYWKLKLKEKNL